MSGTLMRRTGRWALLVLTAAMTLTAGTVAAQRRMREAPQATKLPYDGRFTFARISFSQSGDPWDIKWAHDYPRAERNFMEILREITTIRPTTGGGTVLALDDPDLFKFPIAYLCEPGFWEPSEAEVQGMRAYLQKGGFMIIDDFTGWHWTNFEEQMRRVIPDVRFVQLDASHPIFDSFYRIESLDYLHPNFRTRSQFIGVFEDNDPSKRLLMIVNYENDIGDYWEFSDVGRFPVDLSNTAYKLGVNYVVYGMTR